MDALTLHYYTLPGDWSQKGSATVFDEEAYYTTIEKTLLMEELLDKHIHIMDQYDKEKRVALIVDEWGSWYDVEPGTNPGFLYQQNTMRDAMIAGINLNLFNKHSDRVRMANIAQTVNVLQAVILTEGDQMVLTPTYHVFDLYKVHQDSQLLESYITKEMTGNEHSQVKNLIESASIDEEGRVHVTICNLDLHESKRIEGTLLGLKAKAVESKVLKGMMNAHNTFDEPEAVKPEVFKEVLLTETGFETQLPPCSVVLMTFS